MPQDTRNFSDTGPAERTEVCAPDSPISIAMSELHGTIARVKGELSHLFADIKPVRVVEGSGAPKIGPETENVISEIRCPLELEIYEATEMLRNILYTLERVRSEIRL